MWKVDPLLTLALLIVLLGLSVFSLMGITFRKWLSNMQHGDGLLAFFAGLLIGAWLMEGFIRPYLYSNHFFK